MFSSRLPRLFLQTTGRGSTGGQSEGLLHMTLKSNRLSTLSQLQVSDHGLTLCKLDRTSKTSARCNTLVLHYAYSYHQRHLTNAISQQCRRASTWGSNFHLFKRNDLEPLNNSYVQPGAGWLLAEQRRNAGHSKWQNIRHIKGAKDAQKMEITSKLTRNIRVAIREGGSPDPKANIHLARVLEQAKQADVPKGTVENTIKNVVAANKTGTTVFYDSKIPGSFVMIIEAFTASPKRTKIDIQICFKKYGGLIDDKMSTTHFFDYKGVVVASDSSFPNLEAAEEAAIIAEAEEVEKTVDDFGNPVFRFICDLKATHSVKTSLTEQYPEIDIRESGAHYVPKVFTYLSEPAMEVAAKLVDALESLEEVVRVYTNIKAEGDP